MAKSLFALILLSTVGILILYAMAPLEANTPPDGQSTEARGADTPASEKLSQQSRGMPDSLLMRVSFDDGRKADFARGGDKPSCRYLRSLKKDTGLVIEGKFGKAWASENRFESPQNEAVNFNALGNVLPERGTVAFHIREIEPRSYGYTAFAVSTVIQSYGGNSYLRIHCGPRDVCFQILDESFRVNSISAPGVRTGDGAWHHIAICWDQAYGMRLYVDGTMRAENWGAFSWTSRGVDPESLHLFYDPKVAYDELYVFDAALSASQVKDLAEKNALPMKVDNTLDSRGIESDGRWRNNRFDELSWHNDNDGMPFFKFGPPGERVNTIRQIVPRTALAVKKECNEAFDGKTGHGWPTSYTYEFAGGNGLHFDLPEPFNLVVLEGKFKGKVYEGQCLIPDERRQLTAIESKRFCHWWNAGKSHPSGWLSFFSDEATTADGSQKSSRIVEASFFMLGDNRLSGTTAQRYHLRNASTSMRQEDAVGNYITGLYGKDDQTIVQASPVPPPPETQSASSCVNVKGLHFHHIVLPAPAHDIGIKGVRCSWKLGGAMKKNKLHIEVRDPLIPSRRIFSSDFSVDKGEQDEETLDFTLDLADRIAPAEKPLWMIFCFEKDVDIVTRPDLPSFIDVLTDDPSAVVQEFLRNELPFVKNRFRQNSGPRPWGESATPETELAAVNRQAAELFLPLAFLKKCAPDDQILRTLWDFTHKNVTSLASPDPVQVPGCPEAPRWALYQRELITRSREILDWWIDNRQVPNGEFGEDFNDDTDLVQEVPRLAWIADPGGKLRSSLRLVADGVYTAKRIEHGLNTHLTDTLHAYEEGVNAQVAAAMAFYGEPRFLERLMESALTIEEKLTARDTKGRLRFRSGWFSLASVKDQGDYGKDTTGNALMCHPALFLAYHNHNQRALQFIKEYTDGWLDIMSAGKRIEGGVTLYPRASRLDGTCLDFNRKALSGYGFVDLLVASAMLTGDERYKAPASDYTGTRPTGEDFFSVSPSLLDLVDMKRFHQGIITWARTADLSRPTDDNMNTLAQQRYTEYVLNGNEKAAYEALEGCVRKMRATFLVNTWGEINGDRVWPPNYPAILMMQGGISYARNQLWPRHRIAYAGLSDFAAWVRRDTGTALQLWLYNFSEKQESGIIRVWDIPLGSYAVHFDMDRASAGRTADFNSMSSTITLHHGAHIPVTLPPRKLCMLEYSLTQKSKEDFWLRPDAAIGEDDVKFEDDGSLSIRIHNLGNSPLGNLLVRVRDEHKNILAETVIVLIEAPVDLHPRMACVRLPIPKPDGKILVSLDPDAAIAELDELNNEKEVK